MKVPCVRISQLCGMWLVIVSASVASAQTITSPSVAPANTPSPAIPPEVTQEPSSALPGSGSSNQTSDIPSDFPSDMPSLAPTPEPSFETVSRASARFRQEFRVENGRLFNDVEILFFQGLYASYTSDFAPPGTIVDRRINSTCIFLTQSEVLVPEGRSRVRTRRMQNIEIISVDFAMEYASLFTNVTTFPEDFQRYIINDLDTVAEQMQLLGLNVSEAFLAVRIVFRPDPTVEPTPAPTLSPTVSLEPSSIPSDMPSLMPSGANLPATSSPSASPTSGSGNKPAPSGSDVAVIVVSVLVAVAIVLGGIYLTYRRKKQNDRKRQFQNAQAATPTDNHHTRNNSNEIANEKQIDGVFNRSTDSMGPLAVAASPSIISNQSLLSAGNSIGGDSGDEVDTTHNLADEFDQYKDQNLEKMRAGVEGNLTGFDGMMSQALTRALIDEDDSNIDATELLWGGSGQLVGAEIEASALGEVSDWLKRKDAPSDAERYVLLLLLVAFSHIGYKACL